MKQRSARWNWMGRCSSWLEMLQEALFLLCADTLVSPRKGKYLLVQKVRTVPVCSSFLQLRFAICSDLDARASPRKGPYLLIQEVRTAPLWFVFFLQKTRLR